MRSLRFAAFAIGTAGPVTERERLRVESLGGGLQSSAMALMSFDGLLERLDGIVFADTQHEMPETYAYLDFLEARAKSAAVPFIRATAGDLKAELFARQGRGMQPNLPVRVREQDGKLQRVNAYRCSYDFKRRVVAREMKRLCGARGAWKRATVEQWIGYSTDEVSRIKRSDECRCGHKRFRAKTRGRAAEFIHGPAGCSRCGCEAFDPWQVNRWPLIELQMSRGDVSRWFAERGYPEPPRSACYFCPNRGNGHWRDLRANHPDLWASAVEVDEFVRHGMNEMRGEGFLHQSGVALADADIRPRYEQLRDIGIEPLFTDETDTDCDAGVCFT